jgi:CRISPR/Cas system-associated endonuclease Cas1
LLTTCTLSGCSEDNVQIGAVIYAYDAMFGIMHYKRDASPAFVFDLMEPERPKVDRGAGFCEGA